MNRRRGSRWIANRIATRTAWRWTNTISTLASVPFPFALSFSLPFSCRTTAATFGCLTSRVAPLETRLPHQHHISLDALLWAVWGCSADRWMVHRTRALPISIGWVAGTRRRGRRPRNGIGLLLGRAHGGVATRRAVIWGASHWRRDRGGRASLMVSCAAVRAEAAGRKQIS